MTLKLVCHSIHELSSNIKCHVTTFLDFNYTKYDIQCLIYSIQMHTLNVNNPLKVNSNNSRFKH